MNYTSEKIKTRRDIPVHTKKVYFMNINKAELKNQDICLNNIIDL